MSYEAWFALLLAAVALASCWGYEDKRTGWPTQPGVHTGRW
jgi:hypothetical protein